MRNHCFIAEDAYILTMSANQNDGPQCSERPSLMALLEGFDPTTFKLEAPEPKKGDLVLGVMSHLLRQMYLLRNQAGNDLDSAVTALKAAQAAHTLSHVMRPATDESCRVADQNEQDLMAAASKAQDRFNSANSLLSNALLLEFEELRSAAEAIKIFSGFRVGYEESEPQDLDEESAGRLARMLQRLSGMQG